MSNLLIGTKGKYFDTIFDENESVKTLQHFLAKNGQYIDVLSGANDTSSAGDHVKSKSHHKIVINSVLDIDANEWKIVNSLVASGISNGTVKPLNTIVFNKDDLIPAFETMKNKTHSMDKVLLEVNLHLLTFIFL